MAWLYLCKGFNANSRLNEVSALTTWGQSCQAGRTSKGFVWAEQYCILLYNTFSFSIQRAVVRWVISDLNKACGAAVAKEKEGVLEFIAGASKSLHKALILW